MLLIPAELQHFDTFLNRNGFVEDAMQDERDRKNNNPWTDEEKSIFEQRYVKFPKRFHKIAEGLPNKTVNECVSYYYASKHSVNYKKLVRFGGRKINRTGGKPRSRELANLGIDVPSNTLTMPIVEEEEEAAASGAAFGGGSKGVASFSLYGPAPAPTILSSTNITLRTFSNDSIMPITPDVFPLGVVDYKMPQPPTYAIKKCIAYEPIPISSPAKNTSTSTRRGFAGKLRKLEIGLPVGETVVKLKQRLKVQNKKSESCKAKVSSENDALKSNKSSFVVDKDSRQNPSILSTLKPAISKDDMAILTLAKHIVVSNPYSISLLLSLLLDA